MPECSRPLQCSGLRFQFRHLARLLQASCLGAAVASPGVATAAPPLVVAVDGVLCDLSKTLAGPQLRVQCLIPPGADPHQFVLRPSDRQALDAAELVVLNGYGLSPALKRLRRGQNWVAVAEQAVPQSPGGDPHVWHDPANLRAMTRSVAAALNRLAPSAATQIQQRSKAAESVLNDLDNWAGAQIRTIPKASRIVVSEHRAFSTLARRYGLRELALLPAFTTTGVLRPSSLASISRAVQESGTRVLFSENAGSSKTLRRISRSSGTPIDPSPLVADGLARGLSTVQTATRNICTVVNGQGGRCDQAGAERLNRRWSAIP
jgi:ABC-type Zn uptake system ZnuABC Zn-binding protein ZnuA